MLTVHNMRVIKNGWLQYYVNNMKLDDPTIEMIIT